jgi:hypothetical protein
MSTRKSRVVRKLESDPAMAVQFSGGQAYLDAKGPRLHHLLDPAARHPLKGVEGNRRALPLLKAFGRKEGKERRYVRKLQQAMPKGSPSLSFRRSGETRAAGGSSDSSPRRKIRQSRGSDPERGGRGIGRRKGGRKGRTDGIGLNAAIGPCGGACPLLLLLPPYWNDATLILSSFPSPS